MNIFYIKCHNAEGVEDWLNQYVGRETVHWKAEAFNLVGRYKTNYNESRRSPHFINLYHIVDEDAVVMFKLTFGDVIRK